MRDKAVAGGQVVKALAIEPSDSGTVDVTSELRTSQPPAVADVYGCSFEIPPYLKAE